MYHLTPGAIYPVPLPPLYLPNKQASLNNFWCYRLWTGRCLLTPEQGSVCTTAASTWASACDSVTGRPVATCWVPGVQLSRPGARWAPPAQAGAGRGRDQWQPQVDSQCDIEPPMWYMCQHRAQAVQTVITGKYSLKLSVNKRWWSHFVKWKTARSENHDEVTWSWRHFAQTLHRLVVTLTALPLLIFTAHCSHNPGFLSQSHYWFLLSHHARPILGPQSWTVHCNCLFLTDERIALLWVWWRWREREVLQ